MITESVKTWGDAVTYTFKTKDSWRNGNGQKTAMYNTQHFTNCVGNSFPLAKITPSVVNQACMDLADERGMSSSTQNRVISAISTVLKHCHKMEVWDKPVPKFERRKEGEHRRVWFTKEEVDKLAAAAVDPYGREDLSHILLAAAYTGMRQGELLKLRVKDIDFGSGQIHVGGREGFVTKASNYRAIPINKRIQNVLQGRCEYAKQNAYVFGDDWPSGKDQLIRAFKKVRNYSLNKEDVYTFHVLRHSFATWLGELGVPVRTIMELMGHKNIETTLIYLKATDQSRYDAIQGL